MWLGNRKKQVVRDFTFIMDLNNVVQRPKTPSDSEMSRLRNLAPILESYHPTAEEWSIVERLVKYIPIPTDCPEDLNHVPLAPNAVTVLDDEDNDVDGPAGSADHLSISDDTSDAGSSDDEDADADRDQGEESDEHQASDTDSDSDDEDDDDDNGGDGGAGMNLDQDEDDEPLDLDHLNDAADFDLEDDNMHLAGPRRPSIVSQNVTIIDLTTDDEDDSENDDSPSPRRSVSSVRQSANPEQSLFVDNDPVVQPDEPEAPQNAERISPNAEGSLFFHSTSPELNEHPVFTVKVEERRSDSPRQEQASGSGVSRIFQTPARQTPFTREETSLFFSPTRYSAIVTQSAFAARQSTRELTARYSRSPASHVLIDLTDEGDAQQRSRGESAEGGAQKRSWGESSSESNSDGQSDTVQAKKPRYPDSPEEGSAEAEAEMETSF